MAKRATKTTTPRKIMPPKFIVTNERGSNYKTGITESAAESYGTSLLQPRSGYGGGVRCVGIYRLVKVLRPKETPVEIEEISCCDDA